MKISRAIALFGLALTLPACEREAPPSGSIRVGSSWFSVSSESRRPVILEVADYVATPHPSYFFVRPKSTLHFRISEDFLGGHLNPSGGPQLNVFLNVNIQTGEAWSHCDDFPKPQTRCPGQRNRVVVIHANRIDRDRLVRWTHSEITPEAEEFPLSSVRGHRPSFKKGKIGPYGVITYRGGWAHPDNPRAQFVEGFNTYSTDFFLYPLNYRGSDVKFVKCQREERFCKADIFYCDKLVKFLVWKDELGRLDEVARRVRSLIKGFHIEKTCPGEPFRPKQFQAPDPNGIRVVPAERRGD